MTTQERIALAKQPIIWTGDLSDDCTAKWAGLKLRAEWMNEDYWWWAIFDTQQDEATIDNSNNYSDRFIGGEITRQKAESVARQYITEITTPLKTAKYLIAHVFKITGRGLVFAGFVTEGLVSNGDTIEFTAFNTLFRRRIIGVEGITKSQPDKVKTGLLINCTDDAEIDNLRNWNPDNLLATIYKDRTTENNLAASNISIANSTANGKSMSIWSRIKRLFGT